ncbi:hypothetical protein PGTUg99_008813 [Puccinia graminis f. sp. tritici]|uniref:Uncharacterized protein n=1 Tax=Puccinia graminis f. sp. tritici TaxID=56615 RepID=A0A5B0LWJ3_PUCGR|nr:hypothetical protein PGTUg99_008813 [Puccinia graminis f. sp. tritici]
MITKSSQTKNAGVSLSFLGLLCRTVLSESACLLLGLDWLQGELRLTIVQGQSGLYLDTFVQVSGQFEVSGPGQSSLNFEAIERQFYFSVSVINVTTTSTISNFPTMVEGSPMCACRRLNFIS